MYRYTQLKFWEPESLPMPSIGQASKLIDLLIRWGKNSLLVKKGAGDQSADTAMRAEIIDTVKQWFPSWDGSTLGVRFYKSKGRKDPAFNEGGEQQQPAEEKRPRRQPEIDEEEAAEAERQEQEQMKREKEAEAQQQQLELEQPKPAEQQKPQQKPQQQQPEEPKKEEPKPEPKPAKQQPKKEKTPLPGSTLDTLNLRIEAGIKNFWLVGPAGTGKTTMCKMLADSLDIPCTVISCNAGTSPSEFRGYQFPEPRPCALQQAIAQPGIIVLDEVTMLDPSVAAVANALLANNEIQTTTGLVTRDPECIIIATANTLGTGADRQYIGNNQLDAATLDRFTGGYIHVDYDRNYELSHYDKEVCEYVFQVRERIIQYKIRRIASTRAIIAATKAKAAKLIWKEIITETWTDEERRLI
jgi:MoxR-like ATPase